MSARRHRVSLRHSSIQTTRRRRKRLLGLTLALIVPVLFGIGGASTADAQPTAFAARAAALSDGPTTPILDDFNRPDEDPLSQGGQWAPNDPRGGCCADVLSVVSNAAQNIRTSGGGAISYRLQSVPADMELYATIAAKPVDGRTVSLIFSLRQEGGASSWDGYYLNWAAQAGPDEFRIHRCENNSTCTVVGGPVALEYSAGDKLMVRRIGPMIEGWVFQSGTWSKQLDFQDPGGWTGGKVGLNISGASGGARLDDFGGGPYAGTSTLTITTQGLPGGVVGSPYSQTLAAAGGAPPYTWSVASGTLPPGLTLNTSSGAISGTPTTDGTSSFTARVTDSAGQSATRELSITIAISSGSGPTTPILDDFNRPNEDPLSQGGAWSPIDPRGSCCADVLSVVSNAAQNIRTTGGGAISYRQQTFPLDMEFYATIAAKPSDGRTVALIFSLREVGGATSWDGYYLGWRAEAGTDQLDIHRCSNNTTCTVVGGPVALEMAAAGDRLMVRRIGPVIEGWVFQSGAWTKQISIQDPGGWTGTLAGLHISGGSGARLDDYGGGALASGPPPPPPSPPSAILDNFNRADEDPLSQGGQWAPNDPRGTCCTDVLRVNSNQAMVRSSGNNISYRTLNYPSDVEVFATITSKPGDGGAAALLFNLQQEGSSGWDGYFLTWDALSGTDTLRFEKINNGLPGPALASTNVEMASGNKLMVRRLGNQMRAYVSQGGGAWTLKLTATDSSLNGGKIGAVLRDSNARLDDFGGGFPAPGEPPPPPDITTTSLPGANAGVAYSATLQATGGTAPLTWSRESGSLPSGLTLNSSTGEISGTPTSVGTSSFTIRVTDATSMTDTQALSITTASNPNAPNPPIIDNFDGRGSENPVSHGGNWSSTGIGGGATARISNSRLVSTTFGSYSYRVRPYIGGPFQAAVRIRTRPSNNEWVSVFVALQNADTPQWSGYELRAVALSNTTDRWEVRRIDADKATSETLASTFYEIPSGGWMLLRRADLGLEVWTRTSSGPWVQRMVEAGQDLWDQEYMHGMIGTGLLRSGELDDFSGGSLLTPLEQYAPELRPSAFDSYRASSAEMLTDNISAPGVANRLVVLGGETRAQPDWDPPRKLSLDYLRDLYPPDDPNSFQLPATSEDYLDAVDENRLEDAQRMQGAPAYRNKTYARVVPESGGRTTLQYWFFYYYNWHPSTFGEHEGDWEMVQFELNALGVPTRAAYSQHGGGERCDWSFAEKGTAGRPVVYVARGSHASFFRDGLKPPRWPDQPPGGDSVDGNAPPEVPSVIDIGVTPQPRWLAWPGFWGDRRGGQFSSPDGPRWQGAKWAPSPAAWADGADGCWEAPGFRSPDSEQGVTASRPPAPKVIATRIGKRVRIAYSFRRWPSTELRPVMLLTAVQSSGTRYPPYMKRHRISKRSGVVWQPLGLGKGPFKIFAAAYSRDGVSSATATTRVRGG